MTVWDLRVKEIRESLDRYSQYKTSFREDLAKMELFYHREKFAILAQCLNPVCSYKSWVNQI